MNITLNKTPFLACTLPNYKKDNLGLMLREIEADTFSFTGKKSLKEQIQDLSPEAFPSEGLRNHVLIGLQSDKNILELHKEYYSALADCETLDEAKILYPELNCVVDAKTIDLSNTKKSNLLRKIDDGFYQGLSLDNLSLELLKKYYGELISPIQTEEMFALDPSATRRLLKLLNISFNSEYLKIIAAQKSSNAAQKSWQDENYRLNASQKRTEYFLDPIHRKEKEEATRRLWEQEDYRKRQTESHKKLWQDPIYAEHHSKMTKLAWQDEERRKKQSEAKKILWQDPEWKEKMLVIRRNRTDVPNLGGKMLLVNRARVEAWKRHPEFSLAYHEIAVEFYPYITKIREKEDAGGDINDIEERYRSAYYAACHKAYPYIPKIIGETQREVLKEWGYKDKTAQECLELFESLS